MKRARLLRWMLSLGALALGLSVLLAVWLVRSEGGRDWLLARVVAVLPSEATLRWDRIEGTLSGPLQIDGIHFTYEDKRLDIERLRVDHGLWPLLSGRLDIRTLEVRRAVLRLPRDDQPLELPRWPEVLPRLEMPLTVAVAKLRVRGFRILRENELLVDIASADGGFTLEDGALQLTDIAVASDRGKLRLAGGYRPRDGFRTALDGQLEFPALQGVLAAKAQLKAEGTLDDFRLALDGAAPAPLSVRLHLTQGRTEPQWRLDAKSESLLIEQLGLPPDQAYVFDLHAVGAGGAAKLQGKFTRGDLSLGIAPSRVRLEQGVITLEPLALSLEQGPVNIVGTLALEGERPRFDLRASSQALKFSPQTVSAQTPVVTARGQVRMQGQWQDWTLDGDATFRRGKQQATVALKGRGDAERLRLDAFTAATPNGKLQGSGELHWSPRMAAALQAKLSGFDPGYFFPDFPGAVSGRIEADGGLDAAGRWRGQARLADLRGTLRQRALQGQASLRWDGDSGEGELALRIGRSHITGNGRFGRMLDLQAQLAPLDLADIWPDAAGRLEGSIAVRGTQALPAYRATLQGQGLRWGETEIARFDAHGELPAHPRTGRLQVNAQGIQALGENFEHASLDLTGNVTQLRARAQLAGDPGELEVAFDAASYGSMWQGRIETLRLAPKYGPAWTLDAAAAYRYRRGMVELDRSCLQASAPGGELCVQTSGTQGTFQARRLPLSLVQPWLAAHAPQLQVFGEAEFEGSFARAGSGPWNGSVNLRSARGGLRVDPQSPRDLLDYHDLRIDARLLGEQWTLDLAAQLPEAGSLSGHLQSGLSDTAAVQGQLHLDVRRLTWMELFSSDLADPRGRLDGALTLSGRLATPSISGEARLSGFSGELPALGVQLREGDFVLHGEPGGQTRLSGQVRSGKGVLRVQGTLDLADADLPLELTLRGENITVADTPELQAQFSPDLRLHYAEDRLQIRGAVTVPTARIDLERLDSGVSPSPDVVVLDPREATPRSVFAVDTDIDLRLGESVKLKGFGLDGTLGGALHVRDRPGRASQATGTLEVTGKYSAYGRVLQIKRGRLSYIDSAYDNPALDIVAERKLEEVTVGVQVRGTALAPQTTVISTPAMDSTEALSWLVLGRPLNTASAADSQRLSASAMALGAGSNLLAQQIGARLGLDQAGVTESRALGGSALSIGKQVSPRLFVSYGVSLLGTGQLITLKYLMAHGFNVALESGEETAGSLNWRKEK